MAELSELIAKLEGLSGPSREVDRQIMSMFYRYEKRHIGALCWDDPGDTCCPGARHLDNVWVDPDTDKWRTTAIDGFEFTSSLDVAVALVERKLPGWRIEMRLGEWPPSDPRRVTLWSNDTKKRASIFGFSADAPTPATALVLALLRALSSEQGNE